MSELDPLLAWRDTLADLGVLGLVPPPVAVEEPVTAVAPVAVPERSVAGAPVAPPPIRPLERGVERPMDRGLDRPSDHRPSDHRPSADRPSADRPVARPVVPSIEVAQPKPFQAPSDPRGNPPQEAVAAAPDLAALEACIQDCHACPLGAGRIRFVFGEGNTSASLMFIGEGPGKDEDLQGRPFVGKAGELLDKMIASIGFAREQVYIANVVKCRPPDNRTPLPEESARCLPYLRRQIELVRPKVIVTLGATPLRELLGVTTGITRIRGQWQRLEVNGGIPVMPTFHPAYVLRQYTQDVRRAVYQDLLAAKDWLEKGPSLS